MANLYGGLVEGGQGLQEWRFVVEGFAGIADENGGDTEGFTGSDLHYKCGRGGVPCGVAAGFESCPQAAAGKRGCVGFLLDQRSPVEFFDGGTIAFNREKRIMLFCRSPCQRLEPMGKVRDPFAFGPLT